MEEVVKDGLLSVVGSLLTGNSETLIIAVRNSGNVNFAEYGTFKDQFHDSTQLSVLTCSLFYSLSQNAATCATLIISLM